MRHLLFLLMAVALLFASCAEEACDEFETGNLTVENQTQRTLTILTGTTNRGSVQPQGSVTFSELDAGSYDLFLRDETDPTRTWSETVVIASCQTFVYEATE